MENLRELMRVKRGFVLDLDGTLYLGDELIPGAAEFVRGLRRAGKRVAFVSNKAVESRAEHARKLARLGIECSEGEIINSSLVLARYLQRTRPGGRVFPIAEGPVVRDLESHGLAICEDPDAIDVVAISWDRGFNYRKLDIAYRAALRGADLVATNPDRTCPMQGYRLPDAACMIAAVEACTQRKVDPIVGKPSRIMLREVLELLGLAARECIMVGDRLETDMLMARQAGLAGVLVLTGVTSAQQAAALPDPPTAVVDSVADLLRAL